MKRNLLKLMMLLAMVVVAGSAMAQSKTSPSIGVPYTYNLTGIGVISGGTAVVTYTDANVSLPSDFAVTNGTTDYSFDVTYNAGVADGRLKVTITEQECSNFIEMVITPMEAPTYNIAVDILAMTTGQADCQANEATAAQTTVGTDAVTYGNANSMNVNTLTVQVAATDLANVDVSGSNTFSYSYTISITNTETELTLATVPVSGVIPHTDVTALVATEDYAVSFVTVAGLDLQHIVATVSDATITVGSQTAVNAVITTPSDNVIYKTMPAIGSFN